MATLVLSVETPLILVPLPQPLYKCHQHSPNRPEGQTALRAPRARQRAGSVVFAVARRQSSGPVARSPGGALPAVRGGLALRGLAWAGAVGKKPGFPEKTWFHAPHRVKTKMPNSKSMLTRSSLAIWDLVIGVWQFRRSRCGVFTKADWETDKRMGDPRFGGRESYGDGMKPGLFCLWQGMTAVIFLTPGGSFIAESDEKPGFLDRCP